MATTTSDEGGAPELASRAPAAIAEEFFAQAVEGVLPQALAALPKTRTLAAAPAQFMTLAGQFSTAARIYGGFLGVERVRETRYSPSLVRVLYVMKRERHFLVWEFLFYRAGSRW